MSFSMPARLSRLSGMTRSRRRSSRYVAPPSSLISQPNHPLSRRRNILQTSPASPLRKSEELLCQRFQLRHHPLPCLNHHTRHLPNLSPHPLLSDPRAKHLAEHTPSCSRTSQLKTRMLADDQPMRRTF